MTLGFVLYLVPVEAYCVDLILQFPIRFVLSWVNCGIFKLGIDFEASFSGKCGFLVFWGSWKLNSG